MGNQQISQYRERENSFGSKSRSKGKRIFDSGKKSLAEYNSLPFSRIQPNQQNYASRPSESMSIPLFLSRMTTVKTQSDLNLTFYKLLQLDQYNHQQSQINTSNVQTKQRGEIRDGKPHGLGVLISKSQRYEGWFNNGVKHNHGRQIRSEQVYEGQFQKGRRKGTGTLHTKQATYTGHFYQQFIKGVILFKDGRCYEGQMRNGLKSDQKGIFTWPNPSNSYQSSEKLQQNIMKYQGSFQKDTFNGQGTLQYFDGSIFIGTFVQGLRNGYGTLQYTRDSDKRYEGQFWNNQRHGTGKLFFSIKNNYYYQGQFKHNQPHGKGILNNKFGKKEVVYDNGVLKII